MTAKVDSRLPLKYIGPKRHHITTLKRSDLLVDSATLEYLLKIFMALLVLFALFCFCTDQSEFLQQFSHIPHHELLFYLFVLGIVFLSFGVTYSSKKTARDNELKIVECSENGIRIGAGKFDIAQTYFVSWNHVTVVEAVAGAASASGKSESSGHYLLLDTIQKNVYQLRWENAFAWVDEEEFFSIVTSSASHARLNFGIEEVHRPDKLDTRYTNLWLHYFSAPTNRQRRGKLEPGEKLQDGSYEIIESLSGGGQGTAYLARVNRNLIEQDNIPGGIEQVVLKEYVLPVYRGNKLEKQKYNQLSAEAQILSGLDHEKIVKLYDCFVEDHRGYLVLEYISGFPLSRLVKEKGVMAPEAVAALALDVTGILTYLHDRERPIIHRDLTPDNLMLDESSRSVKLLDFTVARESSIQRTATIVGKQSYMPPEQFRGDACPASDIYSLACTMFYLLTGIDPKPMEMEPVSAHREDADDGLDAIIMKAGAFELEERYNCAADMAVDLQSWLRSRQEF